MNKHELSHELEQVLDSTNQNVKHRIEQTGIGIKPCKTVANLSLEESKGNNSNMNSQVGGIESMIRKDFILKTKSRLVKEIKQLRVRDMLTKKEYL